MRILLSMMARTPLHDRAYGRNQKSLGDKLADQQIGSVGWN
jgi:hypothetical protein